jgi:hypothetical protein
MLAGKRISFMFDAGQAVTLGFGRPYVSLQSLVCCWKLKRESQVKKKIKLARKADKF